MKKETVNPKLEAIKSDLKVLTDDQSTKIKGGESTSDRIRTGGGTTSV